MTGRSVASMVLAAMGCGLPSLCPAQVAGAGGQVVTLPPEAGGFGGAYASPSFSDSSGYGGPVPGPIAPAGYAACPPQGDPAAACPPESAHCWPWKIRPLFIHPKLLEPPRGTYLRLEYLLWEIEEPGSVFLGQNQIEDETETQPFQQALDNTTSDGFPLLGGGFGYIPNIDELQLRDNSGIRLTFGVPLKNYATFEGSVWLLEEASDKFTFEPTDLGTVVTQFNPVLPVSINGVQPFENDDSTLYRVFDELTVNYESDMWGGDARIVVDAIAPPGEGFKLRPLFGFKYIGFQEAMLQSGTTPIGTGSFVSTIRSDTDNTILGGTVGLRTELVHRWFTVGVEPAVTFAGNVSQATVVTEGLGGPTEGRAEIDSDYFEFSPVLDLKAYARIKCTENMNVHVGYDAFWLARVFRPANVIDYNISQDPFTGDITTDFGSRRKADHVAVEGLSVGVEFIF